MSRVAPWLADSRWPTVPIRYFAKLGTGHTPSRQKPEFWSDCNVPWVTLADVWQLRDGTLDYVHDTKEKISHLGLANSSAVRHPAGTVILSRTASVGFSAIMGNDMATSQDFATWTCSRFLEPKFLLYVLRAMAPDLRRVAAGSTHKTIYMPDIEELRTPLPPLEEQQRVVDFLDAELRRLEGLRVARLKTRELLLERMKAAIAEAFTPSVHDRMIRLGLLVEKLTVGIVIQPAALYAEHGVPFLRGQNLSAGHINRKELRYISEENNLLNRKSILQRGDVLVSRVGLTGQAAVVPEWAVGGNCVGMLLVRPGRRSDPQYIEMAINSRPAQEQLRLLAGGSVQEVLNTSALAQLRIPKVPLAEQRATVDRVSRHISPITTAVDAIDTQLRLLRERREALITRTVNGQVDVTTAREVDA